MQITEGWYRLLPSRWGGAAHESVRFCLYRCIVHSIVLALSIPSALFEIRLQLSTSDRKRDVPKSKPPKKNVWLKKRLLFWRQPGFFWVLAMSP